MKLIYGQVEKILRSCESDFPLLPPTQLYNEGWMLRLTVDWFRSLDLTSGPHPLAVPPDCRWYSEALLPSAFLPEYRGDPRAESWTHVDGVIGDFDIGSVAKGDLLLRADPKHFVVLEAKIFSKLSAGVKNASYFNQAARNVACIAEVLKRAGRPVRDFEALAFYVLAPSSQIELGLFDEHLTKADLGRVVERRVLEYNGKRDRWFADWFVPTLDRLDIRAFSWEELVSFLVERDEDAAELRTFYERCLDFNRLPEEVEHL